MLLRLRWGPQELAHLLRVIKPAARITHAAKLEISSADWTEISGAGHLVRPCRETLPESRDRTAVQSPSSTMAVCSSG
jgi:hypothetical protein